MSSPTLNDMIILGAILAYTAVILYGLDGNAVPNYNDIFCSFDSWILIVAFTVSFGAMFAKTWRVYKIFTNKIHKRQIIEDVAIVPRVEICECEYKFYWLGALYAEKGLLLLFGCFLAYETRNVCVDGLNDSKQICVSVYNIVVLCVLGITVNLAVSDNPTLTYGFTAAIIVLCTTFTLCLIFVPKIKMIISDPSGDETKRRRLREGLSVKKSMNDARSSDTASRDTGVESISELSAKLSAIQWKLSLKDKEILKLRGEIKVHQQKREAQHSLDLDAISDVSSDKCAATDSRELHSEELYVHIGGLGGNEAETNTDTRDAAVQVEDALTTTTAVQVDRDPNDGTSTSTQLRNIIENKKIPQRCKLVFINLGFSNDAEPDGVFYV
uniref:Gamma-aminobutyric acid type B receptor subunit 2-like n=1 Tax=Saccoglossus kowalevskii TaxID=10224 RepID=A0ABM0M2W2_SACKO|nr:PREDICTED: gamma-aminobutyric acid type B receptor subunit 2-like [Saccoglossus kowalevskii]